jgi:hypothetical protein
VPARFAGGEFFIRLPSVACLFFLQQSLFLLGIGLEVTPFQSAMQDACCNNVRTPGDCAAGLQRDPPDSLVRRRCATGRTARTGSSYRCGVSVGCQQHNMQSSCRCLRSMLLPALVRGRREQSAVGGFTHAPWRQAPSGIRDGEGAACAGASAPVARMPHRPCAFTCRPVTS